MEDEHKNLDWVIASIHSSTLLTKAKNLAVEPEAQRKGYGKALIDFLVCQYRGIYDFLQVGTGDSQMCIRDRAHRGCKAIRGAKIAYAAADASGCGPRFLQG